MDSQMNQPHPCGTFSQMNNPPSYMPQSSNQSQPSQTFNIPQPSQGIEGRRPKANSQNMAPKANWDVDTTKKFIECCVQELHAGNRPGTHFNRVGWSNIVRKFGIVMGHTYNKLQLKNRWDILKKEWGWWMKSYEGESGLGWDKNKQTVDGSPEWWSRKLKVMSSSSQV